jgi:hypothetical protein
MNADMMKKLFLSLIADAASSPVKAKGKAKGKRKGNPEALAKWRAEQKGKAAPAKSKAKARPKAVEVEEVEGVECGGVEFRKGSVTKQGREYVLIYVGGAFAGSLRVDDGNLLKAALGGLKHRDAVDAIELACE